MMSRGNIWLEGQGDQGARAHLRLGKNPPARCGQRPRGSGPQDEKMASRQGWRRDLEEDRARLWFREGSEPKPGVRMVVPGLWAEEQLGSRWGRGQAAGGHRAAQPGGGRGSARPPTLPVRPPATQGGTCQLPALTHFWSNLPPGVKAEDIPLRQQLPCSSLPEKPDTFLGGRTGPHFAHLTWELCTNYCSFFKQQ